MELRDQVLQIVKNTIAPFLKAADFKKQHLTFRRRRQDLLQILDFQFSTGNTSEQCGFYLNVGIDFDLLRQEIGPPQRDHPKAYECHVYRRLEQLVPSALARWEFEPGTDIPALGRHLFTSIQSCVRFLDSIPSLQAFLEVTSENPPDHELLAKIHYALGDHDRARDHLKKEAGLLSENQKTSITTLIRRFGLKTLKARPA